MPTLYHRLGRSFSCVVRTSFQSSRSCPPLQPFRMPTRFPRVSTFASGATPFGGYQLRASRTLSPRHTQADIVIMPGVELADAVGKIVRMEGFGGRGRTRPGQPAHVVMPRVSRGEVTGLITAVGSIGAWGFLVAPDSTRHAASLSGANACYGESPLLIQCQTFNAAT